MAAKHFLHVRSSPELDQLITQELEVLHRQGAPSPLLNRSVLVRSILLAVLKTRKGQPIRDVQGQVLDGDTLARGLQIEVARELVQQVVVALERATDRALAEALVRLPDALEAELGLAAKDVQEAVEQPAKTRRHRATRVAAAG